MENNNKSREELLQEIERLNNQQFAYSEKVKRLHAQLKTVRNLHEALLKVNNANDFFQNVCTLLSQIDTFKLVWIGQVDSSGYEIKPIAHAGEGSDYLSSIKVTWDDSQYGNGAVGKALRSGESCKVEDIKDDSSSQPWKEEALKRGYVSTVALPLRLEGEIIGVMQIYADKENVFGAEEVDFLKEIARDISIGINSFSLENELKQKLEHVRKTLGKTVEAITRMTEIRDAYTSGHQQRVARLACAIAKNLGLSDQQIEGIHVTGLLHDIGKIAIPIEILTKPGKLSVYEFNIIKTHPEVGYNIVKGIEFPWPVGTAMFQHHERLDGSGYPMGVAGEKIILEAKILGVSDVIEAMSSHRPYRPALGTAKALGEILQKRGMLYDPNVVDSCVKIFHEQMFDFDR